MYECYSVTSDNKPSFCQKISTMNYLQQHRRYLKHVFLCLFFVNIAGQVRGGMYIELGLILFVLGCIFKLFKIRKVVDKKHWLRDFRNKVLIWCVGFLVVISLHHHYKKETSQLVSEIITRVETYHQKNGKYPPTTYIHVDMAKKYSIHYSLSNNTPSLFYPDSYLGLHTYNFEKKEWGYLAD